MSGVSFSTWETVLHAATNPISSDSTRLSVPLTECACESTTDEFTVDIDALDEKSDAKKAKDKKDDKPAKATKSNPFGKLKVDSTPSAKRAAAMAIAAMIGGTGYVPRGETPEHIVNYALIQYGKTGHNVIIDAVAGRALDFATHIGIKWSRKLLPNDLKKRITESAAPDAKDTKSTLDPNVDAVPGSTVITKSMYQTNPLLRREVTKTIALLLASLGHTDAAAEISTKSDWGRLTKYAQMIMVNANKISAGRGGGEFEAMLHARFSAMGLLNDDAKPVSTQTTNTTTKK